MASVVACGKTRLLVPESNIRVRDVVSVDVVLPLTATAVEESCQNPREPATGMKVIGEVNLDWSTPPRVSSAVPTLLGVRKRLNNAMKPSDRD